MKQNLKIIAGLIVAAGITGGAMAQGMRGCDGMGAMGMGPMAGQGGMGGPQGRQGAMKADPAARAEHHLGMMKGQLKITQEQEPLWQAYADKMKEHAGKGMGQMQSPSTDEKLTAPERMAKRQAQMEEHLVAMKGVHESFSRLYAALTPEQKATADQLATQMGQGMRGKAGRMGGAGGGMGTPGQMPKN